jgi:hypothetical protein
VRRYHPANLRAAWWTWSSLRRIRRDLPRAGLEARVGPPPALPAEAERGVHAILRRQSPTCLERALVLQRWLAAHGERHDVIIGVARPEAGFTAHAWLDHERDRSLGHEELVRLPVP